MFGVIFDSFLSLITYIQTLWLDLKYIHTYLQNLTNGYTITTTTTATILSLLTLKLFSGPNSDVTVLQ